MSRSSVSGVRRLDLKASLPAPICGGPAFLSHSVTRRQAFVLEPPYPRPNRAGQDRVRFQSPTNLFQLLSTNSLADCLVVPPTQRLTCE